MLYLLDANTLINAKNGFFQFSRVPEFWEWIEFQGREGRVKIPQEIYSEFCDARKKDGSRDDLAEWAAGKSITAVLLINEDLNVQYLNTVIRDGYGIPTDEVTDQDLETMGQDPMLISYALFNKLDRAIVSAETSKPSLLKHARTRSKAKVPDVCDRLKINRCDLVSLINRLDFKTNFNR